LRASVIFSWEHSDGATIRGEGYTRDISPTGVYVVTTDPVLTGSIVRLEVSLPSLREKSSGAFLRTSGHVVRSEHDGFAAVADMGFKMQFPDSRSRRQSLDDEIEGNGKSESRASNVGAKKHDSVFRFSM